MLSDQQRVRDLSVEALPVAADKSLYIPPGECKCQDNAKTGIVPC